MVLSHYPGYTISGQVLGTHSTGGDTPTCGHTVVALLRPCRTWPDQNQAKPGLHIPLHAPHHCPVHVQVCIQRLPRCDYADRDVPGEPPGGVTLVGQPPVFRKQTQPGWVGKNHRWHCTLPGTGLRAGNSKWPLNGGGREPELTQEGSEYVLVSEKQPKTGCYLCPCPAQAPRTGRTGQESSSIPSIPSVTPDTPWWVLPCARSLPCCGAQGGYGDIGNKRDVLLNRGPKPELSSP